jgi:hypothetical protein
LVEEVSAKYIFHLINNIYFRFGGLKEKKEVSFLL